MKSRRVAVSYNNLSSERSPTTEVLQSVGEMIQNEISGDDASC